MRCRRTPQARAVHRAYTFDIHCADFADYRFIGVFPEAEDGARPIIYHTRAATCRQPSVKEFDSMVNSCYNGWRFEDLWHD
jgi:hypothetical protein